MSGTFCQHVAWLRPGDGTGNSVRRLGALAESLGYETCIFTANEPPEGYGERILPARSSSYRKLKKSARQFHVLQYAGAGYPLGAYLRLPGKKILIYHNLTPVRFFMPYRNQGRTNDIIASQLKARGELSYLARRMALALGASAFNEKELVRLGFARTGVLPNLIDFSRQDALLRDSVVSAKAASDVPGTRGEPLLGAIGRVAPNKNLEQALGILYFLRKGAGPGARLVVVGTSVDFPEYRERLQRIVVNLRLQDAVDFIGHVSDRELAALYRRLDYYVSMSKHEGFGITLLEAMSYRIPVIALARGAVSETMGGAGALALEERPEYIAELIGRLESDADLKRRLLERQDRRIAEYRAFPFAERLKGYLDALDANGLE